MNRENLQFHLKEKKEKEDISIISIGEKKQNRNYHTWDQTDFNWIKRLLLYTTIAYF